MEGEADLVDQLLVEGRIAIGQNFERDVYTQNHVMGLEDPAHTPPAQLPLDFVAPGKDLTRFEDRVVGLRASRVFGRMRCGVRR